MFLHAIEGYRLDEWDAAWSRGDKDNDFDGHFCIHFYASRTHGGNRVDERHQNMVLSGRIDRGCQTVAGTVKKTVQDDGGR